MPSLADSQGAFKAAILDPNSPVPSDIHISVDKQQSRRFDVYRNNVTVSLIDALAATYPAVLKLVGDAFFKATARLFVAQEPPRSPLMFRYGEGLADFLENFPPARSVPYIGDVARLEWQRLQAYHSADAKPLAITALADIDPAMVGQVRLRLHPSLNLLRSRFAVASLWAAAMGANHGKIDPARGEDALTLRPDLEVTSTILPIGAYDFIMALASNSTLEQAATCGQETFADFNLAEHLGSLFASGAVIGMSPPPSKA